MQHEPEKCVYDFWSTGDVHGDLFWEISRPNLQAAQYSLRDHQYNLRDHPGRVQGCESVYLTKNNS